MNKEIDKLWKAFQEAYESKLKPINELYKDLGKHSENPVKLRGKSTKEGSKIFL